MKKREKKEPALVWGIKTMRGELSLPTFRTTKRKCIADYMGLDGNSKVTWRQLKKWGWSCIPILVQEKD